jgi:hypothetical protein
MTRKKLIAFALEFFKAGLDASEVGMPNFDQLIKTEFYKGKIDEILALPIDVPSTLELLNAKRAYPMKKYPYSNISDLMANADRINTAGEGFGEGATWMRDEIIKRNRP